jgi:CubicO group peptidase (beta-lactamase class C family)
MLAAILLATSLTKQIDAYVKRYADEGLFSGVVLVTRHGETVYEKAFGPADRAFNVRNEPSMRFHIASVSKPITAAGVLLLADRGKLSLDDPLSKYVPDFPNAENITIAQLMTHYSGLNDASATPEYSNDWSRLPQTTGQLVDRVKKMPPRGAPGAKYSYSNSNYHILAYIIEKVSGQSYGDFMSANIFKPLGMNDTAHHGEDTAIIPRLAVGYMPRDAADLELPQHLDWTSKTGNGSLYSTARDLLKFHDAMQQGKLLKPETIRVAQGDNPKHLGYFWFQHERFGHHSLDISGSSPGYKASFQRFLDDDVVIIVLSNLYLASPSIIADDIAALVFGEKPKNEPPKRVHMTRAELAKYEGTYKYGPDFYQPNSTVKMIAHDDFLEVSPESPPIVPLANGEFFDRAYWSFIRFDGDKLLYRNGNDHFVAVKQ